jgi:hypothetical protein
MKVSDQNGEVTNGESSLPSNLELAFEYLVAKDTLKWITIHSSQVRWKLLFRAQCS